MAPPPRKVLDTRTEFSSNNRMDRKPTTVKKVVTLLMDAHPTFVSLVGHGANQTPFKSVKIADLSEMQQTQKNAMSKPAEPVVKGAAGEPAGTEIHKIVFAGAQFPTADSVTTYMTSKGYSNFVVDAIDNSFVVKAIDETAFQSITPIAAKEDGVTFFVGKLITAANPPVSVNQVETVKTADATTVTARERTRTTKADTRRSLFVVAKGEAVKADDLVKKYVDYYGNSSGMTCAETLEDVVCGLPLGYWDLSDAFRYALRARIAAGDTAGITALTAEYGTLLTKLATLTTSVEKADERAAALDALFPTKKELGTQVPMMLGIPLTGVTDGIGQPGTLPATATKPALPTTGSQPGIDQPGTSPAPAGGKPNVDPNAQPAIAQPGTCPAPAGSTNLPSGDQPTPVTDLGTLAKALETLQNTLAQLIAGQGNLVTKGDLTGISDKVAKAEERLTRMETVRQVRKSADSDDVAAAGGAGSPKNETPKLTRTQKNILGLQ